MEISNWKGSEEKERGKGREENWMGTEKEETNKTKGTWALVGHGRSFCTVIGMHDG